ncbi:preprotein translocase subunit SecA [Syntrophobacter fumaroxidans]|uniref:Protein translocase subunit SecA n=1 Tax=Syntrophobacter fumaroxidans (strain DSM 10017 / MPOB) TaxID=335543 RepID=SECA_SYNFM|nr:preprotein translocase subunit SecA [Syntrophobacter fumaroxidans]A0LHJ3.1 RecName: Full=Protein translocase subunit SecA [Syntrophobacter fumaroxidans MPOB]ABK16895.1 protein translocase subunit secA [Syntrophobacter fumaroxidans MPOB]
MLTDILKKIFGSQNERILKRIAPLVDEINSYEPVMRKLSDAALKAKTPEFKQRIANGEPLDDLLPEAFAVAREGAVRTLGMRPFDVQMIGGIVLHEGMIAEMKTGEGKTLVAVMPIYLNALTGRGVHLVTVNDYLARRDSEWMGQVYKFLGLSVGCIVHGLDDPERKEAYGADVTYGTNNEYGFDYLRDNMKFRIEDMVQRELNYAIVDEVDSILIDEARTPLIISGPAEKSTALYYNINRIIPQLKPETHYTKEEKSRTVALTEDGVTRTEKLLGVDNLYDPRQIDILHHVQQALRAHVLFKRDVDYIVKDGKVIIVDEFTGRLMPGRRYSEGLHQALEAKENVHIENENQTLASITFQNYFRMFDKLAGMTGTAETEAAEFAKIYKLEVVVIPTHRKMIREDYADCIYRTEAEKFRAVAEEIKEAYAVKRPVLVGTVNIAKSEKLSGILKRQGVPHQVLNAKHHEKEAEIVALAGQPGAVTISTNMAGRGTDIVLGPGVVDVGGLHIIGTERHEARRIDNQLRGRSGRQGDPGSSRFYLSLEDDLMRIFAADRLSGLMQRIGMKEDEPIEHRLITKAIENAQSKVEAQNFSIRKQLLEYDDVMNQQREVIYRQRREALQGENLKPVVLDMIEDLLEGILAETADEKHYAEDWDLEKINSEVLRLFGLQMNLTVESLGDIEYEEFRDSLLERLTKRYEAREQEFGESMMRELESYLLLQTVDTYWKDHLLNMDHLKEGIGLRGYGQQDPLIAYKREGHALFDEMIERIKEETIRLLFHIQIQREEQLDELRKEQEDQPMFFGPAEGAGQKPQTRKDRKVGRNDPCPCGSGKKYKKCCGK